MTEIYNFLAYKQKKEAEEEENKKAEKPDWGDKINIGKLTELRCLVDKLISRTVDNQRPKVYLDEYDLVSFYTDAEIIGWINNFDEGEVVDKPFFYSALIDVARSRGLDRPQLIDK